MNGMDEWQAIQNDKIRLMGVVESGLSKLMRENQIMREALLAVMDAANCPYEVARDALRVVGAVQDPK